MQYGIIQNDNTKESFFWHEKLNRWILVEGDFDAMTILAKMIRAQEAHRDGSCTEDILEGISRVIDKKYT